jgi:Uncharacterized protein conserved in bacteria (DUF2188)
MSKKKDIHIVPHPDGGWATRKEGSSRVGTRHDTQQNAIARGREQAIRDKAELVIHRPNGRIRDSDSYGNDPFPPRDKKH